MNPIRYTEIDMMDMHGLFGNSVVHLCLDFRNSSDLVTASVTPGPKFIAPGPIPKRNYTNQPFFLPRSRQCRNGLFVVRISSGRCCECTAKGWQIISCTIDKTPFVLLVFAHTGWFNKFINNFFGIYAASVDGSKTRPRVCTT